MLVTECGLCMSSLPVSSPWSVAFCSRPRPRDELDRDRCCLWRFPPSCPPALRGRDSRAIGLLRCASRGAGRAARGHPGTGPCRQPRLFPRRYPVGVPRRAAHARSRHRPVRVRKQRSRRLVARSRSDRGSARHRRVRVWLADTNVVGYFALFPTRCAERSSRPRLDEEPRMSSQASSWPVSP